MPGEQFTELTPDLKQQAVEAKDIYLPRRGIIGVYHILLMKDVLEGAKIGRDPSIIVEKYKIDFSPGHWECKFHGDLTPLTQKGLYLPEKWVVDRTGHFFNSDHLNSVLTYLGHFKEGGMTDRNHELKNTVVDLCRRQWNKDDFTNIQALENGLIFGQLVWLGSLRSFRKYDEPKIARTDMKLTNGLISYYEQIIGPTDIKWDLPK